MSSAHVLAAPAGWYPDPHDPRRLRWWSGSEWTAYTHPPVAAPAAQTRPPRRWLGRFGGWIIVAGSAGIWVWIFGFAFLFAALSPGGDDGPAAVSPFLLITGAATVGLAILYTMAYKLRPDDRLTAPRLVLIGLLGGLFATLVAAPANTLIALATGGGPDEVSPVAAMTAGVVEELAKAGAAVVLSLRLPVKDARIGLFVGGAVGIGFSMVENVQYLLTAFATGVDEGLGIGPFILTAVARQLTGPFLHPVFSALLGAAIFSAARGGRFRLTGRVVLAYLGVAAAHGGYNGFLWLLQTAPLPAAARGGLILLLTPLLLAAIGVAWLLIVRRIRETGRTALGPAAQRVLEATRAWGARAVTTSGPRPDDPAVTLSLVVATDDARANLLQHRQWLADLARWSLTVARQPREVVERTSVEVTTEYPLAFQS